jgi:radical SAM protein with 4Fe4S-binding SPASM domain
MTVFNKDFNVVYIRVVQGCNLNCTHCFTLGNRDPIQLTDLRVIERYLNAIKKNVDPEKITFYIHGGETFLAPLGYLKKVNDLIRGIFNGKRFDIVPQTNLTFKVGHEFLNFVREEYNNNIGVSWDADIRFNNSKQEALFVKNLRTLIDEGIKTNISITVQKYLLKHDPIKVVKQFDGACAIDFELLTTFDEKTKDIKVNNNEWSDWYDKVVDYYQHHDTTWCLPQVDLFVKSFTSGTIFDCKCNCCDKRTFTLNPNGSIGFCPDRTYVEPLFTVDSMESEWEKVEEKAIEVMVKKIADSYGNEMCITCEHYDFCGGNCESDLFDNTDECPLSRKTLTRIKENLTDFKKLFLDKAKPNLIELRQDYD